MLLAKARVNWKPYPHCIVKNALPENVYERLVETRPPDPILIAHKTPESNVRVDVPTRIIKDYAHWQTFIFEHTGLVFWRAVLRTFGMYIRAAYPSLQIATAGIRGTGIYDLSMECQPGVNTPCTERSRVVGPHIDNPTALYAGFLYMPADGDKAGGEFEIRRFTKRPRFYGQRRIDEDCTEIVYTVPYEHNTLVMFINTPDSVHSVSERNPCAEYRRFVNVVGEVNTPLFRIDDYA